MASSQNAASHDSAAENQAAPAQIPDEAPSAGEATPPVHPAPVPLQPPQLHNILTQPLPQRPLSHHAATSSLHTHLPPAPSVPSRTANSTPMSSPGLFSPTGTRHASTLPAMSASESTTPVHPSASPFLHPLQSHKVRETHKALIDSDITTGRKLINQYEVIEEIGRGMHGKVKLARNLETGENVAIKIIPRFSKKRRLGKVTAMAPEDKTKKEIAILKKIRHPNVVALLEVIDDPELKKIYMVLEHAEYGEIIWRKKGLPHICHHERRRVEREMRGEPPTAEEEKYDELLERRQAIKEIKRAKMAQNYAGPSDFWSVEHGAAEDGSSAGQQSRIPSREDFAIMDASSRSGSRQPSRAPSRAQSLVSMGQIPADLAEDVDWEDNLDTPGPYPLRHDSGTALDGTMYGPYVEEGGFRGRSPSMADSIISHMSSVDYNHHVHDTFADDFSYVPCFSIDQARSTFRDTVLGLEYLHYQGVVHRDIKPANLLWSKDHRVKISDFGVSYFGRPIRDGEADDTVSESEAKDFDDDLELSKTVGTPAFFAPELCYTDLDQEQPKVSEQVDVWSLGVTLYCLIFARIPFLAEDEFQMFRKIATDDVYIPRRRLKPVDPSTSPNTTSLYNRHNTFPHRDDNSLEYEEVDNLLFDLLRQMLTKNPEKRIRLRDIKRHPWVVQGITNPIGWLDDTDPARPSSGRKIQVDEREMSHAVVPLTFLERARSTIKKAVGKVMHPLVERGDSRSRHRATSSAASSAGESLFNHASTPQSRNDRRRSIRPGDYFSNSRSESPTNDYNMMSAEDYQLESVEYDPLATVLPLPDMHRAASRNSSGDIARADKSESGSSHRRADSRGRFSQYLPQSLSSTTVPELKTTPSTPFLDGSGDSRPTEDAISPRSSCPSSQFDETIRSQSVDRALFVSTDKRAQAQVGLNTDVAPGSVHTPRSPRPMRSIDFFKPSHAIQRPLSVSSPQPSPGLGQQRLPQSDPNMFERQQTRLVERPKTAHRMETALPDAKSPPPRVYNTSTPESFERAQEIMRRKEEMELHFHHRKPSQIDPATLPCPPSPDDDEWTGITGAPPRGDTMTTVKSSSTDSMFNMGTPLTSPSEVTSPMSGNPPNKNASDRMLAFQSDPSLPALLSGASSVSADLDGEPLNGSVVISNQPSLFETTDSLTPPALIKEPTSGFPMDEVFENRRAMDSDSLNVHLGGEQSRLDASREAGSRPSHHEEDDEDGSDEDILLMARSKKKRSSQLHSPRGPPLRRDTNASTASNETAKRVAIHSDDGAHAVES